MRTRDLHKAQDGISDYHYINIYIYIYIVFGVGRGLFVSLSLLFELKGKVTQKAREFANTGAVFIC